MFDICITPLWIHGVSAGRKMLVFQGEEKLTYIIKFPKCFQFLFNRQNVLKPSPCSTLVFYTLLSPLYPQNAIQIDNEEDEIQYIS
jgi:hypothetical protein